MRTVTANGANIPAIGFGTHGIPHGDVVRMVSAALDQGFRHIDTAQIYRNEAEVGESIAASGIARTDLFLTTKVWVTNYEGRAFASSVDESLRRLRTDYVDLLLLHWPGNGTVPLADQVGHLNEAVRLGKARHIGISNFTTAQVREAVRHSQAPLATNQIEYHPFLDQSAVIEAARRAGLAVTAYFAMAGGRVFHDTTLAGIAANHGRSVAQIVLRWLIQQDGVVALSRTTRTDRIRENLEIFDFDLLPGEMKQISALVRPGSRISSPSELAPEWD